MTLVGRCADAEDCTFPGCADFCSNRRTCSPPSFLFPFLFLSALCYDQPVCSLLFRISFLLTLYESCIICPVMYRATQLFSNLPQHSLFLLYFVPTPTSSRDTSTSFQFHCKQFAAFSCR